MSLVPVTVSTGHNVIQKIMPKRVGDMVAARNNGFGLLNQ